MIKAVSVNQSKNRRGLITRANFSLQIILLSIVALAFAEPKPGVISSQTVTTTHHAAPVVAAAAPVVAAAPAIAAAPIYHSAPVLAAPAYYSSYYSHWPAYYGAAYTAPLVSHAAPIWSAGYTVPSVYGYSLNSPLVSPYHNYLLLKKKK